MPFQGQIRPGFGTGAFYVQLPHYFKAFSSLLRVPPFPGTLNVLFSKEDYSKLDKMLDTIPPLIISGKEEGEQGDWKIECYYSEVWTENQEEKVRALLLRFSRPDHKKEIIEFVSAYYLREKYHLEDNDSITFSLVH